ncbi:Phage shock protein PspC (stress-responsive transcriptional regulator) [Formosa sp. Hel1_31_208]|uniref:PspC domain-containing protein n=1 Tax=Formosa sp. Hel1_31_208 TaxID=1798225 RepID=UPI00087C99BB|nr:PspC domain-containing protein [Formosa sp. Hel1_31_208]SDS62319.1 Phage shock protein PspC (stress-responsive transcriptional regulator) [Formosa sp. Hel1_31_208]
MNKTVNINLAGIFFHIDEEAYLKLQRYLEAIKRSFTDSQGRSEIISDIEARIAELFSERVQNERQVIGTKEVDDVITIMGQPEDYLVDDEIFEDEPRQSYSSTSSSSPSKKLYRDTDNSYIGGVSAGLGHYFAIDALWIRLIWILLIFGAGTGVLLYILLWIFVPEAKTTTEKLMMKGEPVNITNIEKKIKDGFDSVTTAVQNVDLKKQGEKIKEGFEHVSDSISESVKKVDLPKQGERIKSTSTSFFETLGNIIMFFLKIFAKFFGLILMFVGAVTIISLVVSLLSLSLLESVHIPGTNFFDIADAASVPLWLMSLLVFFFVGIIAFFVFYLGLKILITNLKSIGNAAKYTLLGLWLISFVSLIILSARFGLSFKEEGSLIKTEKLVTLTSNDTITVRMSNNDLFASRYSRNYGFDTAYDENDNKVLYSQGVRLIVKSTKDSIAKIRIERSARGFDFEDAKTRAERISYKYDLQGKELLLDSYLTIPLKESRKGQEVTVTIYLPEGSVLFADRNTYNFHSNQYYYNDILDHDMEERHLKIITNGVECLDCPEDENFKVKVDVEDEGSSLQIDEDGIKAKSDNSSLQIDEDGIKATSDDVKVNIDDSGIEITTEDDN